MCDYSLEQQASRAAVAGETLVTTAFAGSTTLGFASPEEPAVAICLRPGTELAFAAPVSFAGLFRFLLQGHPHDCRTARVRHVNAHNPLLHHDALEFANGQVVLLTHLRAGQHATVIQLPAAANAEAREAVGAGT